MTILFSPKNKNINVPLKIHNWQNVTQEMGLKTGIQVYNGHSFSQCCCSMVALMVCFIVTLIPDLQSGRLKSDTSSFCI